VELGQAGIKEERRWVRWTQKRLDVASFFYFLFLLLFVLLIHFGAKEREHKRGFGKNLQSRFKTNSKFKNRVVLVLI
jgi:hypothetical protein